MVDASVDAVAAKLRDLLVDGGLRERMGTAARELVAERFTWDQSGNLQLESVYQQLLHFNWYSLKKLLVEC